MDNQLVGGAISEFCCNERVTREYRAVPPLVRLGGREGGQGGAYLRTVQAYDYKVFTATRLQYEWNENHTEISMDCV